MHHLYRHYDEHGTLLYVGESLSSIQRLASHKDAVWFHLIRTVKISTFASKVEAIKAETDAIRNENPLHNIKMRETPRYVISEQVWALEIASADRLTCTMSFKDERHAPLKTHPKMWARYQPIAGDFYVLYADGDQLFLPRDAFTASAMKDTRRFANSIGEERHQYTLRHP